MPHGGARNRSGPSKDPASLRSERLDYRAVALPSGGFDGVPPRFPLPKASARERAVWAEVWRTPQAAAWAGEAWRWRTIGQYVRWSVRMEDPEASASLGAVVMRLADQIGLTPAGLKENGWQVARDELAGRREPEEGQPTAPVRTASTRERMAIVDDGGS